MDLFYSWIKNNYSVSHALLKFIHHLGMRGQEKGTIDTAKRREMLPLSPKGKKIHKAAHMIIHYGK